MGDIFALNSVQKCLKLAAECVRKRKLFAAEYFFDKADQIAAEKKVGWEIDQRNNHPRKQAG